MKYLSILMAVLLAGCASTEKESNAATEPASEAKEQVELLLGESLQLGEGAYWDGAKKLFYYIDIEGMQVRTYTPESGQVSVFAMPSRPGTVVPCKSGALLVALEDGLYRLNTETQALNQFVSIEEDLTGNRLNDGKCDPAGRLWVGSMDMACKDPTGTVYMIDGQGNVTPKIENVTISNGIVWNKAADKMYYIDTPTGEIAVYDYDNETGEISNRQVAVKIEKSFGDPDGMAIDADDNLWVGMWNGNCLAQFNSSTGALMQKIEIPAHNVTACAFTGEKMDELIITTASIDMSEEEKAQFPSAGGVFSYKPGVAGVASTVFAD